MLMARTDADHEADIVGSMWAGNREEASACSRTCLAGPAEPAEPAGPAEPA